MAPIVVGTNRRPPMAPASQLCALPSMILNGCARLLGDREIARGDIGRADEREDGADALQDEADQAGDLAALCEDQAAYADESDGIRHRARGAIAIQKKSHRERGHRIGDVVGRDHLADMVEPA